MKRLLGLILALLLTGSSAEASGYAELNAGLASGLKCDQAVPHLNAALAAPDLLPAFRAAAHYSVGVCHFLAANFDLAMTDYTASIASDPTYREAYVARADLHDLNHEFAQAAADRTAFLAIAPQLVSVLYARAQEYALLGRMEEAISDADQFKTLTHDGIESFQLLNEIYRLKGDTEKAVANANAILDNYHGSAAGHRERGFDYFAAGDFARARGDFSSWSEREPEAIYPALWTALAAAAQGDDAASAVGSDPSGLDEKIWPAPLLKFYQGKSSADDVAKAVAADGINHRYQQCEADFYVGDLQMHRGDMSGKAKVENAAKECPMNFIELRGAILELRRLP